MLPVPPINISDTPDVDLASIADCEASVRSLHAEEEGQQGFAVDLFPATIEDREGTDGGVGREEVGDLARPSCKAAGGVLEG